MAIQNYPTSVSYIFKTGPRTKTLITGAVSWPKYISQFRAILSWYQSQNITKGWAKKSDRQIELKLKLKYTVKYTVHILSSADEHYVNI